MNVSSAPSVPSYQPTANVAPKAQPATTPPPAAPAAPVDSDGDHDGSILNKLA